MQTNTKIMSVGVLALLLGFLGGMVVSAVENTKGEAAWDGRNGGQGRNYMNFTDKNASDPDGVMGCSSMSQDHVTFTWRPSIFSCFENQDIKDLAEKMINGFDSPSQYPTKDDWDKLEKAIYKPTRNWPEIMKALRDGPGKGKLPKGCIVRAFTDENSETKEKIWQIEIITETCGKPYPTPQPSPTP